MKHSESSLPVDLANFSNPIADIFEQPKNAAEWEQYILTKDQLDSFRENGYVSGIKILSEEQVELLNEELIKL